MALDGSGARLAGAMSGGAAHAVVRAASPTDRTRPTMNGRRATARHRSDAARDSLGSSVIVRAGHWQIPDHVLGHHGPDVFRLRGREDSLE